MKDSRLPLACLIALIIGGAAGYFIGTTAATPPQRNAAVPAGSGEQEAIAPSPVTSGEQKTDTGNATVPVAPSGPEAPNPFDQWIANLDGELPRDGAGRIHGRVADKQGNAISGATITVTPAPDQLPPAVANPSLEETVARNARLERFAHAGKREAETDHDGQYEFANLGAYDYRITGRADGYRLEQTGQRVWRVAPDAEVNFEGTAVVRLPFDVRLPDGSQPDSADLVFESKGQPATRRWSPRASAIQMDPGTYTLTAFAGEHREFVSEPIVLEPKLGQSDPPRRINLLAKPGILCVVNLPPGLGRGFHMSVDLIRDPADSPPATPVERVIDAVPLDQQPRGRQGRVFRNLEPGRYRVVASGSGRVLAWKDVELGYEFVAVTLDVPELGPEDYIIVRLLGPDGEPVTDASVSAYLSRGAATPLTIATILPKPEGEFWITRMDRVSGAAAYRISVESGTFGSVSRRHPADGSNEVTIRMAPPATLAIHLPGASSHPLKSRIVPTLTQLDERGRFSSIIRPRDSGLESETLTYGPMPAGRYSFTLRLSLVSAASDLERFYLSGSSDGVRLQEWTFELVAGENTQTYSIPEFHTLTLLVPDGIIGQRLSMRRADGDGYRDINGEAVRERTVLEGVAAGEWIIRSNTGETAVRVSGDTDVSLVLMPFDCLRLRDIKGGGKLAQIGFRIGDLLIAVDGQEYEDIPMLRNQVQGSYAKDSTTWTLLRGGVPFDIRFNGKEVAALGSLPGNEREAITLTNARR